MAPAADKAANAVTAEPLTGAELKAVMAINAGWPYPAEDDGWVVIHKAIRLDMEDIVEAVRVMIAQVQGGKPLEEWQPSHLQKYWPGFAKEVEHHHNNEEELLFPWITTKVVLPPKMSADHTALLAGLEACATLVKALEASGSSGTDLVKLLGFQGEFAKLKSLMEEHLDEEEQIGLPLMRQHFTYAEFQPIEKKIIAGANTAGLAHFLRPLGTLEARAAFMTSPLGIPKLIQSLILIPAIKKYDRNVVTLLEELKSGERKPKPQGSCCW